MTKYTINTRQDLIVGLHEAVQVEHCLMLQYLYAAFALKQVESEGLTWQQLEAVNEWKRDLLRIAKDEMGHLGTVLNMLTAIGGAKDLRRPNFPLPAVRWFPFPFELTPLNEATLERFVRFEQPQPAAQPFALPAQPVYDYVGELYRAISDGFQRVGAANPQLFVGDPGAQDSESWATLDFAPRPITSVPDAVSAVDAIILQGEGTPAGSDPKAHFATFTRILEDFRARRRADPLFVPSRPAVANPALRHHPEAGPGATLIDERSLEGRVCSVFSQIYALLLQLLEIYYDGSPLSQTVRGKVQKMTRNLMTGLLRPIGEVITTMPLTGDATKTAGPTFEVIGPIAAPPLSPARWILAGERMEIATADLEAIVRDAPQLTRLASLPVSAKALRQTLKQLETIP
jgi:hypothetical protein